MKHKQITNFIIHKLQTYLKQCLCSNANLAFCILFTYCLQVLMESNKHRTRKNSWNQIDTEEIREKDRERQRKTRVILRGEEVLNQPIANNIGNI